MYRVVLIVCAQLSLATAVPDVRPLIAAELNLQLEGDNALSSFFEETSEEAGVHFVRGSRAADSPLSPDIDVQCSADFIQVTVEFPDIFEGIIYSKGYFKDPKCKYIPLGDSQSRYSFRVPLNGCGSRPLCNACGTIDNVLVFQADDTVQGPDDFSRKVSCTKKKEQSHVLRLKPFMVNMLDVVAVQGPAVGVECWMDIQKGVFPNTFPLERSINIGEYLTILIYLKDTRNQFNLKIQDCWAYENEEYDRPQTKRIQLTDKEGCPMKKRLIDSWQKSTNTGRSGATLIAYNKISAFRFLDTDQVYLTCNVVLCKNSCDSSCSGTTKEVATTVRPQQCYPSSTDPRCKNTTELVVKCYPGSLDPRCLRPNLSSSICFSGNTDPRCQKHTLESPRCFPGSIDPRCPNPNTPEPPRCFPGSYDPRCPMLTTPTCYPGSPDPSCPQPFRPNSFQPLAYLPAVTPTSPACFPGNNNPRCPKPTTLEPPGYYSDSTDPRFPNLSIAEPLRCYPGSTDPRCSKVMSPKLPRCDPGSTDPRCSKVMSPELPKCYPGNTDPRCSKVTSPELPRCNPASTDPCCHKITSPELPKCYLGSTDPCCPKVTTLELPRCHPGSTDPRCPKPTTPEAISCTPGSTDPRCSHIDGHVYALPSLLG